MRDFMSIPSGSKGSHRKFTHARYAGAVTVSGKSGDDAPSFLSREEQVKRALEKVKR
ncbi:MAG: hypothetical protein M0C28_06445 [Candidatus Moduliflexus flocculans]|nr:hypothetical protein [Candidatus Moduliflexus flocculans]